MKLLIISIPLLSSFSIYFLGRYIGQEGGKYIALITLILNTIISIKSIKEYLEGKIIKINIKEWFEVGQIRGKIELIYDKSSILMINLITIITLVVIIYSFWYLAEEPHKNRFISKILLFAVAMYILVSSKNYILTFFGWELVGCISYLLINFWYISIQNNKSAIKAMIFNKIGDIFYLFGLLIIAIYFYNFDYQYINSISYIGKEDKVYIYILLFFIIAAIAKSAQIFLHCWLGDAMAGPTPVSALLHAATMVTAGIYILLRCENIIYISNIQYIFIYIGSITILFAGLSSLNQNDIKKIIAYSTCAQIGYMFFVIGLFKPLEGSLYHLITHGFFKALLFLSAGIIIHSYFLEQDLRKYGNIIFLTPLTYIFFLIGTLAIIGFPPLAGFYSKDLILIHSLESPISSFFLLILGSLLSSFYSFKLLYYSFFNSTYKSIFNFSQFSLYSYIYFIPFIILLLGSLFIGYLSFSFFNSPETINLELEFWIYYSHYNYKLIPLILPFLSFLFLFFYYKLFSQSNFTFKSFYLLYSFFNRRFFFDTFYNYFLIKPSFFLSYHITYKFLDRGFLEILGPLSLFRLFFFFPSKFNLNSQKIINLSYLYIYFFISILVFIFPYFLF